ncbi:hypothetical protein H8K20_01570 [Neobittarella massiliensis]|uniref:Uncharacterized protein n=1 Tax=Neobittarella massiliensis (ex Bilen et al. 2018) TaxID=2041842 RepID=A0A8J6ILY8_9FIRM|nr:hypothetical protein [Neobittarella massiliensis]MBC3515080.1 hypothetical protein [Neobittarella massiliensis]
MLGKLIKHEFKATSRIYLPMFGAVLLLTLVSKGLLVLQSQISFMDTLAGLSIILYVCVLIAVFVVGFVVMIQRFYKNLLGDEGYLMNTLPVSPASHIWSKFITATVWSIATVAVVLLSILILVWNREVLATIGHLLHQLVWMFEQVYQAKLLPLVIETIIAMLVGLVSGGFMVYCAIAIGHQVRGHRLLGSIGAYVVLYMTTQILSTGVIMVLGIAMGGLDMLNAAIPPINFLHGLMLSTIGLSAVIGVACFIATNYLLKHKLNLE